MAKIMEPTVNVNEVSRISTGTVIKGEITSPNDIRIDGSFEGKIISKGRVVVGEKAVISGDIICENVDFWGKMTGCFYVKDTLALKEGCVVDGDLNIRRLVVELGAKFDGNCKMLSDGDFDKLAGNVAGTKPAAAPVKPVTSVQAPAQAKPVGGTPLQN
ncbi:MAG: polymer-forming cytoskeletal protein [Bacteroidales bacterium]|nr:polymer-forming cytoskeletal protein [Bacteroidales bacterium]